MKSTILDGWPVDLPVGRTEKLGIEPATAQLGLGLGLSLAKSNINVRENKEGHWLILE